MCGDCIGGECDQCRIKRYLQKPTEKVKDEKEMTGDPVPEILNEKCTPLQFVNFMRTLNLSQILQQLEFERVTSELGASKFYYDFAGFLNATKQRNIR